MPNRQIGVLWAKQSKTGTNYLSGTISLGVLGERNVVIFKSLDKRSEGSPDWIIYASTHQRQANGVNTEVQPDPDDDIPF
jgi:hypothetical protein